MNESNPHRPPGGFESIRGQEPAVETLTRALDHDRVHHAYRVEGPPGVGKEMAAFAMAQALVCDQRSGPISCGECRACRRAVQLADESPQVPQHPDVVLIERGLYPPSMLGMSTPERMGISIHQVRRIVLERVGFGPHEGRALVFIIRNADEITVGAANALLKTLEEPAPKTHFILLTHRPARMLDTILSRTLAVRFAPLDETLLSEILQARGLPTDAARIAQGSAELAVELSDAARSERRKELLTGVDAAIAAPDLAAALSAAPIESRDRQVLRDDLEQLAEMMAVRARDQVHRDAHAATKDARGYQAIQDTLLTLEQNAQPGLAIEALITRLRMLA